MDSRAHRFLFKHEREPGLVIVWNNGYPFFLNDTQDTMLVQDITIALPKQMLLRWAAQNQIRCVGFEDVSLRPRRPSHADTTTWAVVG